MPTIRRATTDDAAMLATLGAQTFHDTFAEHNDPADMAAYLAVAYGPAIQRAELETPGVTYLVLEHEGEAVAYAMLRAASSCDALDDPAPFEIKRFYVDRRWHGQGLADTLMAACEREAQAQGARSIWLAVWERNVRAMRFYARHGFAEVGSQAFLLGGDTQRDLVLARPAFPGASTIPASGAEHEPRS